MGYRSKCKSENYNVYRRKHIGESLCDPGTQRFLRTQKACIKEKKWSALLWMHTAALFITAKSWVQSKCLLSGEWITSLELYNWIPAQMVRHLPTMQKTQVQSLGWEDPLEKEMATTHSSTLAWQIPWTEEHGRLQSMGSQSRTRLSDFTFSNKKEWITNIKTTWITQKYYSK